MKEVHPFLSFHLRHVSTQYFSLPEDTAFKVLSQKQRQLSPDKSRQHFDLKLFSFQNCEK
jgi:hypothetical protein